jgi:hypothetical protein
LSSLKCAQCGLVNFATDSHCKRCRQPLAQNAGVASSGPQGIVLEDGYVLPPPPAVGMPGSGVWRDQSKMVVSKGALLPARCVKCNAPATGPKIKKKLSWHHPAIFILLFVALLIYLIVAMILRKTAVLELGLCEKHRAQRRRNVLITWALILLGFGGFVMAGMFDDMTFLWLGMLLLFAGIIYGVVTVRIVWPSKIDDQFAWVKGINKDYLNQLPQWPGV